MSPTHQDLSNDTTFSQIKSRVPVPLRLSFLTSKDHNPMAPFLNLVTHENDDRKSFKIGFGIV